MLLLISFTSLLAKIFPIRYVEETTKKLRKCFNPPSSSLLNSLNLIVIKNYKEDKIEKKREQKRIARIYALNIGTII